MKPSTSIHETITWGGRTYRCAHEITHDEVVALLESAPLPAPARDFISKLKEISGGWPTTKHGDPRERWFQALEQLRTGEAIDPEIEIRKLDDDETERYSSQLRWNEHEFFCFHYVEPYHIAQILDDWERGRAEAVDVMAFAENLFFPFGVRGDYAPSDPRYEFVAIVGLLEMIYTNPILREDIPVLKEALALLPSKPTQAGTLLDQYFNGLDRMTRLKEQSSKQSE